MDDESFKFSPLFVTFSSESRYNMYKCIIIEARMEVKVLNYYE